MLSASGLQVPGPQAAPSAPEPRGPRTPAERSGWRAALRSPGQAPPSATRPLHRSPQDITRRWQRVFLSRATTGSSSAPAGDPEPARTGRHGGGGGLRAPRVTWLGGPHGGGPRALASRPAGRPGRARRRGGRMRRGARRLCPSARVSMERRRPRLLKERRLRPRRWRPSLTRWTSSPRRTGG